jgi:membrane-associated phospholipid phosphatase
VAATTVCALAVGPAVEAQTPERDDGDRGRVKTVMVDIKDYVTAPLHARRPQWVRFGAALGAVAAAYHFDDDTREQIGTVTAPAGTSPDTQDARDAAPAVLALAGTWAAAALGDSEDGRREAGSMLEAAAFSSAAAYAIKELAGRERPYVTEDKGDWGGDGESFPSVHTAAAFAIGTVMAESGDDGRRWLRRVIGYGLAVGTAYARIDHDAHWLSDTVAGAGLGIATARFVMKQRDSSAPRARFELVPTPGGLGVGYTVDLRP